MNEILAQDALDQPEVDETKNYLEELVGDDKKFKSVEDLAKGKALSDSYIKTLEARLDEMREDYLKVREENMANPKLQELLDKLDSSKQLTREPPIAQEVTQEAVDPKRLETLVTTAIQKHDAVKREESNYTLVKNKLIEALGPNYQAALNSRATKLGMSQDQVNDMARRNPLLFMKTFDLDTTPNTQDNFMTPPKTERRSDTFAPRGAEKRNWAYYQEMRKKDPHAWMDKKIAVQMEKDAQEQGQGFYSN